MAILAAPRPPNSAGPRFRTPAWHDAHPAKRDIEQALTRIRLFRPECVAAGLNALRPRRPRRVPRGGQPPQRRPFFLFTHVS